MGLPFSICHLIEIEWHLFPQEQGLCGQEHLSGYTTGVYDLAYVLCSPRLRDLCMFYAHLA